MSLIQFFLMALNTISSLFIIRKLSCDDNGNVNNDEDDDDENAFQQIF